jgi:hypothetical protein
VNRVVAAFGLHGGQGQLVGAVGDAGIQVVVDGAVVPEALGHAGGRGAGRENSVEFHGFVSFE